MRTSLPDSSSWTVASAKAKLSEAMERAQVAPQTITRKGSLAEFLLASPLRGADFNIERHTDEPRDLPL